MQVAALSETAIYYTGVSTVGEYTMVHSGLTRENRTRSAHGVVICLGKEATMAWKNIGAFWKAVNERIVMVRLQGTPINVTIITVYSPVNPNGNKTAATASDKFYNDLQQTLSTVPSKDLLLITGDFNARIGKQQNYTSNNVVGPHTTDHINENGQRLVDFCAANDLIITNTFFQYRSIHQTTWMHPGNKKWHTLDYTLVNRKFRSSVEDVRVHRAATGTIGTGHHLLVTKLKLHRESRRKRQKQRCGRLDRKKLENGACIEAFQAELMNCPSTKGPNNVTINARYSEFTTHINNIGQNIFKLDDNNRKQKEWLTDEILEIVDMKVKAFLEWQNRRGTNQERRYRSKYRLLRNKAKKRIEARQIEYLDETSIEIESAIKQHDPATTYAMIRRIKGGRTNIENLPILDLQGKSILNSQERLQRWKDHFSDLLNVPSHVNQSILDQIPIPVISSVEQRRQEKPPSLDEVHQAIGQMKSWKAPGNDDVSADLLKAGVTPVALWLHEIFMDIWQSEEMVDDWTSAILIRLYKGKGDKQICDNYREISLLVVASEVFSRIILNRVQNHLDEQLLEEQAGFRSNRSTIDQIFTLKMIMEKSRECNRPLSMCFVDIQKAYDSVNRDLLWEICKHYGLPPKTDRLIQLLYKDTTAGVRINDELSDSFNIDTGVQQGGIPSCILFNILFDFIMRRVIVTAKQMGITGIQLAYGSNDFHHTDHDKYEEFDLLALMYADDLVTMCDIMADLEIFIRIFQQVTQQFGLTMSIKKTRVMSLKQLREDATRRLIKDQEVPANNFPIIIRNQTIEIVEEFSYLGFRVNREQTMEEEIETRLSKASTAFNMLRHAI
ncbi:unnamed protein product, partial [Adineta ricciae]